MGEAKRRGSFSERVAEATDGQASPETVRESMGFPASVKFAGYVVHLPDREEFLAGASERQGVVMYQYAGHPDLAKVFSDYRAAAKLAEAIQKHRTVVAYLFDDGKQWLVGFSDDKPPAGL